VFLELMVQMGLKAHKAIQELMVVTALRVSALTPLQEPPAMDLQALRTLTPLHTPTQRPARLMSIMVLMGLEGVLLHGVILLKNPISLT
jgi:hypothetical protein